MSLHIEEKPLPVTMITADNNTEPRALVLTKTKASLDWHPRITVKNPRK
jgi:hypothetical protein